MEIRTFGGACYADPDKPQNSQDVKSPTAAMPFQNIRIKSRAWKQKKGRDNYLLKNVYKNDVKAKMLLARQRRMDSMPKDNLTEGEESLSYCFDIIF